MHLLRCTRWRWTFAIALIPIVSLLTGCATYAPSLPQGYSGPTAKIKDSAIVHSASKVDYFYLKNIDDRDIKNSHYESIARNQGRGFSMEPYLLDRDVPIGRLKLEIVGRTEYAAPILALTNPVYEVKGKVDLAAESNRVYVIKGALGETYSAVWIEDEATGQVMGDKIEINGSAKLGFWQK